jgi:hypothetical protein
MLGGVGSSQVPDNRPHMRVQAARLRLQAGNAQGHRRTALARALRLGIEAGQGVGHSGETCPDF